MKFCTEFSGCQGLLSFQTVFSSSVFTVIHLQMIVLLWSRCRNRSYSVSWSLLLITSAMSIKRLMSRCVITWPDVITNAKPIPEIPTHSHPNPFVLICNLLLRNSLFVGRKNLLSLLSNFLEVMGSFVEKRHGLMPNLMECYSKIFCKHVYSGGSREGAWGSAPLFFDQTEARRAEKGFLETPPPRPFISGSGWPGYTVVPKTFVRLISTKVGDVHHCPRRRGLPKRLLYLRIIDVENKWLLTFCYNVLICRLFIVLSLATDIVSKDLGYLQNRFQEPTVEPETRCACHGKLVLWSQNWQGKLLSVLCRTKKEARLCMDVGGRSA